MRLRAALNRSPASGKHNRAFRELGKFVAALIGTAGANRNPRRRLTGGRNSQIVIDDESSEASAMIGATFGGSKDFCQILLACVRDRSDGCVTAKRRRPRRLRK
jgi:hypothetical protein